MRGTASLEAGIVIVGVLLLIGVLSGMLGRLATQTAKLGQGEAYSTFHSSEDNLTMAITIGANSSMSGWWIEYN